MRIVRIFKCVYSLKTTMASVNDSLNYLLIFYNVEKLQNQQQHI